MSEQPQFPPQPEGHGAYPEWPPPDPAQAYGPYYAQPPAGPYIPPGVELASWGSRLAAYLIDAVMGMVLGLVLAVGAGFAVYGLSGGPDADSAGWVTGVLVYVGVAILWFFLYEPLTMKRQGQRNGQTLGKQMLDIRVVREDGYPVTAGTALMRDVLIQSIVIGFIGGFFYVPPILDGLWPLWDARNQSLHDKVANTFVIRA
jgi:uncharacterized RDD family membrane protein YckC